MILQPHIHIRARLDNRLIQYRHSSHRVVHRIIHVLYQRRTSCSHHHTSARDIHRIQANLIARRTFVFTYQGKLILLRQLLCHHQGRVIQLLEHIFLRYCGIPNRLCQITTKGLQHREDDSSCRGYCCITLHIVKATVWRVVITRVQTIQLHHAQQLFALHSTLHQVLHIRSHRVVTILHIQFKLIARHLACAYRVHVLHHQVPSTFILRTRCIVRALQHLQQQRIRRLKRLSSIRRKLTHLIHLTAIRILIRHSQHLILIQRSTQRNISQCRIQCIFATIQQSSRLHFLIILARFHTADALHHGTRLLNIAHSRITTCQCLIQRIGLVVWHTRTIGCPRCLLHVSGVILTQIHQRHNVARLVIITALIRNPHLYTIDCHAACYIGQGFHRILILVTEVVTQEEVTVLVITINRHLKTGRLCTTFARYRLALAVLLRQQCLHAQLAKLQIRLNTKQRRTSLYQTAIQVHRHITRLYRLNNIILFPLEIQFQVLLIKAERRLRIIVHIEVQLIAHLTIHTQLNLLIKIEYVIIARTLCQRRIIHILMLKTKQQFRRTLQLQLHATRTKHLIRRTDIKLHIGNIKLALVVMFHLTNLPLPILPQLLTFRVRAILFRSHHIRGSNLHIANASTHHIAVGSRVILYRSIHIVRILQIQTAWHAVQILIRIGPNCFHLQRGHHHTIVIFPRLCGLFLRPSHQRQHAQ